MHGTQKLFIYLTLATTLLYGMEEQSLMQQESRPISPTQSDSSSSYPSEDDTDFNNTMRDVLKYLQHEQQFYIEHVDMDDINLLLNDKATINHFKQRPVLMQRWQEIEELRIILYKRLAHLTMKKLHKSKEKKRERPLLAPTPIADQYQQEQDTNQQSQDCCSIS